MHHLHVSLGDRSYDIQIGTSAWSDLGTFARQRSRGKLALVVSDTNVEPHARATNAALEEAGFQTLHKVIPPGEEQKVLASASALYDVLAEAKADRQTLVVAVGGGVIGDLVGFVAATYNRGLALFMVPTTLLAMVDSSVGGKVAVNHPRGKNLIGAFHQPVGVWIDTSVLGTLPEREYRSGLAEVIKYGVILDAEFFTWLESHVDAIIARDAEALATIVSRCCALKARVVEQDEREETGIRAVLNYGHTFAHAFETVAGYGTWLHGEAVAAGMHCASLLAERRGLIAADQTRRQYHLLERFALPTKPEPWPVEALLEVMRNDKKAVAGQMRFVLPTRLGEVKLFDDIPEDQVRTVLEAAQATPS